MNRTCETRALYAMIVLAATVPVFVFCTWDPVFVSAAPYQRTITAAGAVLFANYAIVVAKRRIDQIREAAAAEAAEAEAEATAASISKRRLEHNGARDPPRPRRAAQHSSDEDACERVRRVITRSDREKAE